MTITVHNPNNLPLLPWWEFEPLQDNLKELSEENGEKLWASIEKYGFFMPFAIWPHEGKKYILDGHQRTTVLFDHHVGRQPLPTLIVEAETLTEAKEKLLVITSQFGTVTEEGYAAFTSPLDDDWLDAHVNLDALNYKVEVIPEPPASDSGTPGDDDTEPLVDVSFSARKKEQPDGRLEMDMEPAHKVEVLELLARVMGDHEYTTFPEALLHIVRAYKKRRNRKPPAGPPTTDADGPQHPGPAEA